MRWIRIENLMLILCCALFFLSFNNVNKADQQTAVPSDYGHLIVQNNPYCFNGSDSIKIWFGGSLVVNGKFSTTLDLDSIALAKCVGGYVYSTVEVNGKSGHYRFFQDEQEFFNFQFTKGMSVSMIFQPGMPEGLRVTFLKGVAGENLLEKDRLETNHSIEEEQANTIHSKLK